jgi:hypothetical protein
MHSWPEHEIATLSDEGELRDVAGDPSHHRDQPFDGG